MFGILELFDGPVIPGLEQFEKVWARDQPQYRAMRTLPGEQGTSAIGRFALTDAQRKAIAAGADIFLEIMHFDGPLAPSRVMICEPVDSDTFRSWWRAQTKGPYKIEPPKLPERRADGVMRRIDSTLWAPAEKAIGDAMQAVETAGASVALTDAVNLLEKARNRVADHLEGKP